jgi:hypothetical protein
MPNKIKSIKTIIKKPKSNDAEEILTIIVTMGPIYENFDE